VDLFRTGNNPAWFLGGQIIVGLLPKPVAVTDALVLQAWACGETSSIASYLTRDNGFVKVIAKAARRSRSKLRPLVEPGRLLAVEYSVDDKRDLQYLKGGSVIVDPMFDGGNLERSAFLLAALELVERCRPRENGTTGVVLDRLFAVCEEYVRVLSSPSCVDPGLLFFSFEWEFLRIHGLAPDVLSCLSCDRDRSDFDTAVIWFHPAEGGLVCGNCHNMKDGSGGYPLSGETLEYMAAMTGGGLADPSHEPLPRPLRRELGAQLHRFMGYHLPGYRLPAALDLLRAKKE